MRSFQHWRCWRRRAWWRTVDSDHRGTFLWSSWPHQCCAVSENHALCSLVASELSASTPASSRLQKK